MSTYTITYVTTHPPQGERTVDVSSRLLEERIVYLGTAIDDGVANAIIAQPRQRSGPERPLPH